MFDAQRDVEFVGSNAVNPKHGIHCYERKAKYLELSRGWLVCNCNSFLYNDRINSDSSEFLQLVWISSVIVLDSVRLQLQINRELFVRVHISHPRVSLLCSSHNTQRFFNNLPNPLSKETLNFHHHQLVLWSNQTGHNRQLP